MGSCSHSDAKLQPKEKWGSKGVFITTTLTKWTAQGVSDYKNQPQDSALYWRGRDLIVTSLRLWKSNIKALPVPGARNSSEGWRDGSVVKSDKPLLLSQRNGFHTRQLPTSSEVSNASGGVCTKQADTGSYSELKRSI